MKEINPTRPGVDKPLLVGGTSILLLTVFNLLIADDPWIRFVNKCALVAGAVISAKALIGSLTLTNKVDITTNAPDLNL